MQEVFGSPIIPRGKELTAIPSWTDLSDEERNKVVVSAERTGHKWETDGQGQVLLYTLYDKCFGPRCADCGYAMCVVCETPLSRCGCARKAAC